jgi:hypothetical protein
VTKPGTAALAQRVIALSTPRRGHFGVEVEVGVVTEDRSCRYVAAEPGQVKALSATSARLLDKNMHDPALGEGVTKRGRHQAGVGHRTGVS